MTSRDQLSWFQIVRLGLVQSALGAVVVLTTSTINRVMVVELAVAATIPGALVALHYAVQILRPRLGHGSDSGGRRTPWIIGGMAVLALGGVGSAAATALMASHHYAGLALAVLAFIAVGIGVGAAGTSLLTLLAVQVAPERRAPAATILWTMMIASFVLTTVTAGHYLDPFSLPRLISVTASVASLAFVVTVIALAGIERSPAQRPAIPNVAGTTQNQVRFSAALATIWSEERTRRFTIFVFASMLAYSAQDLILEPFAGKVFGMTPGASTQLTGVQHGGVLGGMLLVALVGGSARGRRLISLRGWTLGGCHASALALASLTAAAVVGPLWPLRVSVFLLGFANGAFTIAAIGAMMSLAGEGRERSEGMRMGLWGAAQALAFGAGGFLGTAAVDLGTWLLGSASAAYAWVFALDACLFLIAAQAAAKVIRPDFTRAPVARGTAEYMLGGTPQ
ncbi:MAG: BCD family MFS transporter [Gammaproteobacteria bacterium]|nr:BCD family MFS transporter [Gammaproteobacteria bacterium]